MERSSPSDLILPLLSLAERDVLNGRLLAKTPPAAVAFHQTTIPDLIQHPLLLSGRSVVVVARLLDPCPQLQRLCFPLRYFLPGLFLFYLALDLLAFLHQLFLLVGH